MKSIMITMVFVLLQGSIIYAKTGSPLPPKDSKVFVTSRDAKITSIGNKAMDRYGYWNTVDDKSKADYIIYYRVKRTYMVSFLSRNIKGYAQIRNAKTGEVVYESKRANTFWSIVSFNHKKTIVRKLNRRIERTI